MKVERKELMASVYRLLTMCLTQQGSLPLVISPQVGEEVPGGISVAMWSLTLVRYKDCGSEER